MPRASDYLAFAPEDYHHHMAFKQDAVYYQPTSGYGHHHSAAVSILTAAHLQYLRYTEPFELAAPCPLDLSLKTHVAGQITPPTTPSPAAASALTKRKRSPSPAECVPAPTPPQRHASPTTPPKLGTLIPPPAKKVKTTCTVIPSATPTKKSKAVRKLNFDEDKSSPVSGTIIRELGPDETLVVRKGDIDPAYNVVEVTEEAKAELAKIENHIGEYVCRLCKELYEDAFQLAQHRCSRIVHVEYRCPECDKVFNCPANLASHRRWHKPRSHAAGKEAQADAAATLAKQDQQSVGAESEDGAPQFPCIECGKKFRRQAYLRKHLATHTAGGGGGELAAGAEMN